MRPPSTIGFLLLAASGACSTAPVEAGDQAGGGLPWGLRTGVRGSLHAEDLAVVPTTIGPADTVLVFVRIREGQRIRVDRIWGTISRGRPGADVVSHGPTWWAHRWSDLSDADLWYVVRRAGGRMLVGGGAGDQVSALADEQARGTREAVRRMRAWLEELGIAVEKEFEIPGALVAWLPPDPAALGVVRSGPGVAYVEAYVPGNRGGDDVPVRSQFVGIVPPPPGAWNRMGFTQAVLAYINPNGTVRSVSLSVR